VNRWCEQWNQPYREVISLEQQWKLAQSWYADRMEFEWRRKTPEEIDTLWRKLGFTSPFWDVHS
jgi:hypothetical protein